LVHQPFFFFSFSTEVQQFFKMKEKMLDFFISRKEKTNTFVAFSYL